MTMTSAAASGSFASTLTIESGGKAGVGLARRIRLGQENMETNLV
jgi:hypothetical protein